MLWQTSTWRCANSSFNSNVKFLGTVLLPLWLVLLGWTLVDRVLSSPWLFIYKWLRACWRWLGFCLGWVITQNTSPVVLVGQRIPMLAFNMIVLPGNSFSRSSLFKVSSVIGSISKINFPSPAAYIFCFIVNTLSKGLSKGTSCPQKWEKKREKMFWQGSGEMNEPNSKWGAFPCCKESA